MKTFRFLEFPVYSEAKLYYTAVLLISRSLRQSNYALSDQVQRAGLSVVLNIAEGSAKESDREFSRFLEISIASVNEVVACLDIMRDCKYISADVYTKMIQKVESIAKQLGGFIKKLRAS